MRNKDESRGTSGEWEERIYVIVIILSTLLKIIEAINIEDGTFGLPHTLRFIYISLAHMAIFDLDSVSCSMPRSLHAM